jgi:SAM-dependent methyltransferase
MKEIERRRPIMERNHYLDKYFLAVIQEGLYSSKGNLAFYLEGLFSDIDFNNKRMLDIGGGNGLFTFYAASRGVKEVVCIEPEAEGSHSGVTNKFRRLQNRLSFNQVKLEPSTFQSFDPANKKFDVVLLHDSINHLDEESCINLLVDEPSRQKYKTIFSKVYTLSNHKAKLIICDCSCNNLFALLGLRNPFAASIEWHKHQTPEVWVNLLTEVGYINPKIYWPFFNTFRTFGKYFLSTKFVSYFMSPLQ